MASQNLKRIGLVDVLGIILLFVLTFMRGTMAGDPGVGWHLLNGQWILSHGAVPQHDPFLFSAAGKNWVANQWLSDIVFYQLLSVGDWALLHLFVIFLVLGPIFFFTAPLLRKNQISPVVSFVVLLLFALLGSVQWILRPVIFSFALFAASYLLLQNWYTAGRDNLRRAQLYLCLLPPIFFLWVNLHPGVVLGLGLLALYAAAVLVDVIRKKRALGEVLFIGAIALLSAAACLLNPYGAELFRYASGLAANEYFMNLNFEWLSTDIHILILLPFGICFLLLVALAARTSELKTPSLDIILLLIFTFLSLLHRRYLPFFGIVSVLPMARLLQWHWHNYLNVGPPAGIKNTLRRLDTRMEQRSEFLYSSVFFVFLLTFALAARTLPGKTASYSAIPENYPHQALNVLRQEGGRQRIFHGPNWGGFISYVLAPAKAAFIDDRNELNGTGIYEEFFSANAAARSWQRIFEKYEFNYALLDSTAPLAIVLSADRLWELRFQDSKSLLFKRTADYQLPSR